MGRPWFRRRKVGLGWRPIRWQGWLTSGRLSTSSQDEAALVVEHLTKRFGERVAVDDVSFDVAAGEVFGFLGPNGAGKTTTLRVASGLLRPTAGSVWFDGQDITRARPRARTKSGICLVPEGRGIFPNLTVRENLRLHTHARAGTSSAEIEEVAYERFPTLGGRRKQIAGTMSGGEQQMLAVSRALTTRPRLLLLDEISMGLAPRLVEELFAVISDEVAQRDVTVLIVEQLAEFALRIADIAVVLSRGSVTAAGPPDEVKTALEAAYLGKAGRVAGQRSGADVGSVPHL
jgi:branched-chain amino acid transport system ATP-binding protein